MMPLDNQDETPEPMAAEGLCLPQTFLRPSGRLPRAADGR